MAVRHGEPKVPEYVHQAWPAFYYHPKTGEGRVFNHEAEVPEGWTDDPHAHVRGARPDANSLAGAEDGGNGEGGGPPAELPAPDDRAGIVELLRRHSIRFNANWKTERMYDTLVDALKPKE